MESIRTGLVKYDNNKVDVYVSYLKSLKNELDKDNKQKNWWFNKISKDSFIDVFKKVYETGLFIDGDSVTLNYRKKLIITYDYHAYKNKINISYPETIFDFGLVHEGDEFTFNKESGKVIYSHNINDPFSTNKKIIGAYGVIKNKRGEFIELINVSDIEKMKNTSNMKSIWNQWYDRMVLKSVIKRICSIHFHDITLSIDTIDNETNEPDNAYVDSEIQEGINNSTTEIELTNIYNNNIKTVSDREQFLLLLSNKKKEIKK